MKRKEHPTTAGEAPPPAAKEVKKEAKDEIELHIEVVHGKQGFLYMDRKASVAELVKAFEIKFPLLEERKHPLDVGVTVRQGRVGPRRSLNVELFELPSALTVADVVEQYGTKWQVRYLEDAEVSWECVAKNAAREGKLDRLLSCLPHVNIDECHLLEKAVTSGCEATVDELLQRKANPNQVAGSYGRSHPLWRALYPKTNLPIAQLLLERRATFDSLVQAIKNDDTSPPSTIEKGLQQTVVQATQMLMKLRVACQRVE